jgi:hypothetical protein
VGWVTQIEEVQKRMAVHPPQDLQNFCNLVHQKQQEKENSQEGNESQVLEASPRL